MKDGHIDLAGTGIVMHTITEIEFPVTIDEMERLLAKLKSLHCGDSTKIFEAEGAFKGEPVRFIIRLKQ